jgi:hypothetical protein
MLLNYTPSMSVKNTLLILFFAAIAFPLTTYAKPILTPTPSPAPVAVEYYLAFPGKLPDHPLYKLKVLRDKLIERTIQDPNKKVTFYLLQADKGILAAAMLIDKQNYTLAGVTALKAEHNMTVITSYLDQIDSIRDPELLAKIKTASRKHQEVLGMLITRVPTDTQAVLQTVLEFSHRNLGTIEQFEASPVQ